MTPDEQLAAIRERHAKYGYGFDPKYDKADIAALLARIDTLTAELAAANASIEHLRMRVREQTAATQEAYTENELQIRTHLEGRLVLGDSTCPIWQRVASAVDTLTTELAAANARAASLDQSLGNVLARIHRDGGHYLQEHGVEKACEDAEEIVLTTRTDLDAANARADGERAKAVAENVAWFNGRLAEAEKQARDSSGPLIREAYEQIATVTRNAISGLKAAFPLTEEKPCSE